MSAYNSCSTYATLLQTPLQNNKLMAPSSVMPLSFSLPSHTNRPLPPTDQPLLATNQPPPPPPSIPQSLPITNTNNSVFDWSRPIKKDGAIAWTNCVRQSITKLESGKFSNVRMTLGSQKYSDKGSDDEQSNLSAFLGPNLWEKSCGTDFKLEYMDLDEFLVENGIPTDPISDSLENEPDQSSVTSLDLKSNLLTPSPTSSVVEDNIGFSDNDSLSSVQPSIDSSGEIKDEPENHFFPENDDDDDEEDDDDDDDDDLEYVFEADGTEASKKPGCSKAPGEKGFNPAKRKFTSDELKPQPLVKKSRKVFVPDEHKDEKYWARRKKNNVAAKRSRDARRVKENQIALRANFLENENQILKAKLEKVLKDFSVIKKEKETLTSENLYLQKQLNKFNL